MTEGAVAAAKAAGKDWEEVSQEKLYKPLGMTSTSSRYKDFIERKNRALGHVKIGEKSGSKIPSRSRCPIAGGRRELFST